MKPLLFISMLAMCMPGIAQNTNVGTNAGNAGAENTSVGYSAGDIIAGSANVFIGHSTGRYTTVGNRNSFVGAYAGYSTTNGLENSFFGYNSGFKNSSGSQNVFLGAYAGEFTTSGFQNTFSGALAGKQNTTASNNAFYGFGSGYSNSTGIKNSFFGSESGFYNTADNNTLMGYRAGYSNTTGTANTYLGSEAGYNNTTGHANSFIGYASGRSNSSGYFNTFLGNQAGLANTIAANNTFVGTLSGSQTTTGSSNTFIGSQSGYGLTTGQSNLMLGEQAGLNTNGSNNVFVGNGSGVQNIGNGNVFIGYQSGFNSNKISDRLIIQNSGDCISPLIYGDFQNRQLGIGTSSLGTYTLSVNGDAFASGLWLSSDKRFKQNITALSGTLEKLNEVKGVSYQFKQNEEVNGRSFSNGTQLGFIAQDLQKVFPELVKENSDGYLAVNYPGMIPVLVEAIKELKEEVAQLKNQLDAIHSEKKYTEPGINQSGAWLEQNHPNPFNRETVIGYTLPETATSSALYLFDLTGKQIAVFDNLKPGKNELSVSADKLSPGIYNYSLVVNGVIVDTRKMLLTN